MSGIFYIAHLGVQYEIYTLAFPFDLSVIYVCIIRTWTHTYI